MENILKKAHELGHLLNNNEIVMRFRELSEQLDKDEDSKKLLEELVIASQEYEKKTREGAVIEVEEKQKISDLQNKAKENELISEFMATQTYYFSILSQVNEAIANPQGEPPKDSNIILPNDNDKNIII